MLGKKFFILLAALFFISISVIFFVFRKIDDDINNDKIDLALQTVEKENLKKTLVLDRIIVEKLNFAAKLPSAYFPQIIDKQEVKTVVLAFSAPKSGTTTFEWIVRHLFNEKRKQIKKISAKVQHIVFNTGDIYLDQNYVIRFESHFKHSGYLYDCDHYGLKNKDYKIDLKILVADFLSKNISGYDALRDFTRKQKFPVAKSGYKSCVHVVIFRDIIAQSLSQMRYIRPINSDAENSVLLSTKFCKEKAVLASLTWILTQEILPAKGYNFKTFHYSDLEADQIAYITTVGSLFDFDIDYEILQQVLARTTKSYTMMVQRRMKLERNATIVSMLKNLYPGMSDKGKDSRKVRNKRLKDYPKALTKAALKICRNYVYEYIPKELLEHYKYFNLR